MLLIYCHFIQYYCDVSCLNLVQVTHLLEKGLMTELSGSKVNTTCMLCLFFQIAFTKSYKLKVHLISCL